MGASAHHPEDPQGNSRLPLRRLLTAVALAGEFIALMSGSPIALATGLLAWTIRCLLELKA